MQNQTDQQLASEPIVVPIEEQITQELVKHNVTETLISELKEKYMPLKLKDLNDKETYVQIKDARRECKSLRVMAEKLCKKGREDANAISKAWVAKEKDVAGRIGEVEDHLEAQEKAFEAEQDRLKAERKRQQEEQLIRRQTQLTNMGALYSDGSFVLGEVSFEMSLIKECEDDIWGEQIFPKFHAEYEKVEAERIAADRKKQEEADELKRQQEQLQRQKEELEQREANLKKAEEERLQKEKEDQERRENEERDRRDKMIKARCTDLNELGMKYHFHDKTYFYEDIIVSMEEVISSDAEDWACLLSEITPKINDKKEKSEQKRLAEIEEQKKIAARNALNKSRVEALASYGHVVTNPDILADLIDDEWNDYLQGAKNVHEQKQREKWEQEQAEQKKQDEIKRQQEMDQAKDKERWEDIISQLGKLEIHEMRSGQYRKKAAILREKLEEVKAL